MKALPYATCQPRRGLGGLSAQTTSIFIAGGRLHVACGGTAVDKSGTLDLEAARKYVHKLSPRDWT